MFGLGQARFGVRVHPPGRGAYVYASRLTKRMAARAIAASAQAAKTPSRTLQRRPGHLPHVSKEQE